MDRPRSLLFGGLRRPKTGQPHGPPKEALGVFGHDAHAPLKLEGESQNLLTVAAVQGIAEEVPEDEATAVIGRSINPDPTIQIDETETAEGVGFRSREMVDQPRHLGGDGDRQGVITVRQIAPLQPWP